MHETRNATLGLPSEYGVLKNIEYYGWKPNGPLNTVQVATIVYNVEYNSVATEIMIKDRDWELMDSQQAMHERISQVFDVALRYIDKVKRKPTMSKKVKITHEVIPCESFGKVLSVTGPTITG